jgi:hypothetical protein
MIDSARCRAKQKGLPFNIQKADITIPILCPILGLPLDFNIGRRQDNSPSLDRIDNSKGYIKGNIQIISDKANRMKNNANREELLRFAFWIYKTYMK